MNFTAQELEEGSGVLLVRSKRFVDSRGHFMEVWAKDAYQEIGINADFVQDNQSLSTARGTLRGLHFQREPHAQAKLVRCTRGAVHDVIVDLRPGSPTFRQWAGVELTQDNRRMLYIPGGLAHGYITMTDDAEVFYQASSPWEPKAEAGVRWNDPAFGITWPAEPVVISERDANWALISG